MMKTTDGFHYAFNAQAVVDEEAQVILAQSVSNQAADAPHLMEMIGMRPKLTLALRTSRRIPTPSSPTPDTSPRRT